MIQIQNDIKSAWSLRSWVVLAVLNAVSVLISGYFGFVALTNPAAQPWISGPATTDLVTYAALFGIRSVLITIAVLTLFVLDRLRGGDRLLPMLLLAGVVQVGDVIMFLAVTGNVGTAIGPAIAAVTHLVSAALLIRRLRG